MLMSERRGGPRAVVVRAAAVAIAVALAACDSVEERVSRHYERGVALLAEGSPEKATLEFRNALRLDENHAPSRLQIGKLYEEDGELSAALSNYRLAAELDPAGRETRARAARLLLLGGQLEEAGRFADEALALGPDDPEALAVRAGVALAAEDDARAVQLASKALAAAPELVDAHVVLISARLRADDQAGALAMLDERLAAAPAEPAYNEIKLRILADQRSPLLGDHLARMADLFPETPAVRRALVAWRIDQGDLDGAERDLRALIAAAPGDPEPILQLVAVIGRRDGEAAARAELSERAASAADPAAAFPFVSALADLDLASGDVGAARARLERTVAETTSPDVADQARVRLARILMSEGDEAGARALADAVLTRDGRNVDALLVRARLAIAADRHQDAIRDLRVAQDAAPDDVEVMLAAALAFERSGESDLAGERYAAAARASDFTPEAALAYARFLSLGRRLDAAETVLAESYRRNPRDRRVVSALAETRLRLEDWAGVEQLAAALDQIEGGEGASAQLRAVALRNQGRFAESLSLLRSVAGDGVAGPAATSVLANLVATYVTAGEPEKARALLEDTLAKDPENLPAIALRAELNAGAGDVQAAEADLRTLVSLAPAAPVGHVGLARLLAAQGRAEESEAAIREGVAATGGAAPLRLMLAERLERLRDFAGAIAEYEALYAADPNSIVIANNYASMLMEHRGDDPAARERAIAIAQRLRGVEQPAIRDTYGWSRFLSGDIPEALRNLKPAAAALPDHPTIRYHLGRAYAEAGQTSEARSELEAALAIDPDFAHAASARETLRRLQAAAGQ